MRRDPPSAVLPVAENMSILCSRCRRFEADDQPITCVVLEGGPCSACRERTMIRQKIKQLEEELAKLKAKHDAVTSTILLFINYPPKSALISFASPYPH